MSDLLAIIGPADSDTALLDLLAWHHPDRVTVLLAGGDPNWATDDSATGVERRDRLAMLMNMIEHRTGATVVGLAGNEDQLLGWRFDRVVRVGTDCPADGLSDRQLAA